MKKAFYLGFIALFTQSLNSQIFYTESFESTSGYSISHIFDDGVNDFCKRDSLTNTAFAGLNFLISGGDGVFAIGAENTQTAEPGSPLDGIVTLELDPIGISGMSNLELIVSLACNADAGNYDDAEAINGDYIIFESNIDNSGWLPIGEFNSTDTLSGDSELFYDLNANQNGGEIGDLPLSSIFKDFVLPVTGTGNSISIRARFRMSAETEEILLDNFRLKQSEGDITPLEVFDAYRTSPTTIDIVFQEDVAASASGIAQYIGISNISTAVIQPDGNTVTLTYSVPFVLGNGYTLVVFGVQDVAGNSLLGTYQYNFYYNDTQPDLVITEIMYNDASTVDSLEFVEIYNNGTVDAILGGLELEDGISFTFPTQVLSPGEFVLVARNSIVAAAYYGLTFHDYSGSLSNTGEQIELVNAEGFTLDSVVFDNNIPWPPGSNGFGPSAELNSPDNDNAIGANWVASTNGLLPLEDGSPVLATPGALPGIIIPTVQFFENTVEINEIDGTLSFMVSISGSNNSPSTVEFTGLGGTANSPADLGATGILPLTFPANSIDPQNITIPIINDTQSEGIEFYRLKLIVSNNATIGIQDTLLILIADDDYISPNLFINELQASNSMTIADEFGEFDDWFEIYNPGFIPVNVAGYYVSDDPTNLLKDRFTIDEPATIIPGGGWLLIWADEQGEQGPLHMNFRLSSGGEFISLTDQAGITVLDSLTFPEVPIDNSYGRIEDGDPEFVLFTNAMSPGASNHPDGIFDIIYEPIVVFPNPAKGELNIDLSNFSEKPNKLRVYNSLMQLTYSQTIKNHQNKIVLDVSNFDNGIYFLVIDKYLVKFVVE